MFLNDKIGFYDIYRLVNAAVPQVPFIADPDFGADSGSRPSGS